MSVYAISMDNLQQRMPTMASPEVNGSVCENSPGENALRKTVGDDCRPWM